MGRNIRDTLLKMLEKQGPISAHQLSGQLKTSRQYVHRVLAELVEAGTVQRAGSPPSVVYSLASTTSPKTTVNNSKQQMIPTVWLTGLSGAGKSTIAADLQRLIQAAGHQAYVIDGDAIRRGLNKDLAFSALDQAENTRRAGELAAMFTQAGVIPIVALISPHMAERNKARSLAEDGGFIEVLVDCPIEVCADRDPKGLYKKAQEGLISSLIGVTSPYEYPEQPEIIVDTNLASARQCSNEIIRHLKDINLL